MKLPSDWGPMTVLTVLVVLGAVVAGVIAVAQNDLQYDTFVVLLTGLASALGIGTAVGRGLEKGRR